jgi:hypothetical protein
MTTEVTIPNPKSTIPTSKGMAFLYPSKPIDWGEGYQTVETPKGWLIADIVLGVYLDCKGILPSEIADEMKLPTLQ